MTHDQWIRKASLFVGGKYTVTTIENGNSISTSGERYFDLSNMHFTFNVQQSDIETPNNCSVRIFNLSDATAKMVKEEFTRIVIQAGYENGAFGVIFDGTIRQVRAGKVNAVDKYLDIYAADNDLGFNFGTISTTLAAGSSPDDQAGALAKAMGADVGYTSYATGAALPRGKVLYGMARDHMRALAKTTGTTWSVQNGKMQVVPLTGYVPGAEVTLTAKTGLIGLPEQTQDGIKADCLLNPKIVVGGSVKIDNASIQKYIYAQGSNLYMSPDELAYFGSLAAPSISSDGVYRVLVAEHDGDTRGTSWYTRLVCLAVNQTTDKTTDQ